MCSCNSSNSAPCSCSCFPKVSGKSPGFCWCRCIKQWEATGREKPELVSVVEGVLTTMREKFPMDLHVLKLEADSMKYPRGDLQRNGSSEKNQTWRTPLKPTKCIEWGCRSHSSSGEACYTHSTRQSWGSGGKHRCGKAKWIHWGNYTISVSSHGDRPSRFKARPSTEERGKCFVDFLSQKSNFEKKVGKLFHNPEKGHSFLAQSC